MRANPSLREFQDRLHLVQAGPIWSAERLETVLGFLLGRYDHLIEEYLARREKGPKQVDAATIGEPLPAGTPWHDPRTTTFDHEGLRIELGDVSHASSARIALDGDDRYAIAFVRGEEPPQEPAVLPWDPQRRGIAHHVVPVPEAVRDAGFDAVLVLPTAGNNIFATGGLKLLGDS